jgi:hypothetical protein
VYLVISTIHALKRFPINLHPKQNDKMLKILAGDVGKQVKNLVDHGIKYEHKTQQTCGKITNSNGWTITIKNDKDEVGACDDGKYHNCHDSSWVGWATQIPAPES